MSELALQLIALEELNLCNEYWDDELDKLIRSKNKGTVNHFKNLKIGIGDLKALKTLRIIPI